MVVIRIMKGEGSASQKHFLRSEPLTLSLRWNTELPSPAPELGFTRVRHDRMAEVG